MDYVHLGNTGTTVSRICLGCMSFGDPDNGKDIRKWTLREDDARGIIRRALELGINFFDTANVYSGGTSEEIVGRALRDYARREEVVLATKVYFPMEPGMNRRGLSRKAIFQEIDASLSRLGTDYVDLYITHRWDDETPAEEIMEALHDVVKAGKARYIGASTMPAWKFAKAQSIAEKHGWTKYVTMQSLYNLIYREEEREMIPLCCDQKVGLTPWSPLAKGRLARVPNTRTFRSENDSSGERFFSLEQQSDREIIRRVGQIAAKRGVGYAEIALAWLFNKPYITAPLVGCTKLEHLESAVNALAITLCPEEIAYLEGAYEPHSCKDF